MLMSLQQRAGQTRNINTAENVIKFIALGRQEAKKVMNKLNSN
jgi:hypothetical protein